MIIESKSHHYEVGEKVAVTGNYRLYLCVREDGRQCLLQIAAEVGNNGELERMAYFLESIKTYAARLEEEYALVKEDPKDLLNYQFGFPELLDSFICEQQGGRWVNILTFWNVDDVGKISPLNSIIFKDRLRVDLRTSAWIMGKALKLLVFTHSQGISIGRVDGNNVLLDTEQHYVIFFELTHAQDYPEGVPEEIRCQEISQVARTVIALLGGNFEAKSFPDDVGEEFKAYTNFLLDLAEGNQGNTKRVHEQFYQLVDGLWKREFYPFTAYTI